MAEDNEIFPKFEFETPISSDIAMEGFRRGQKTLKNYLVDKFKDFPDWRKYRQAKLKNMMQQRHYEHPRYWRKVLQPLGAGFPIEDWAAYKGISKYSGPLAKAGSKVLGPLQFMTPGKAMAPDLTEEQRAEFPITLFEPFERGR